MISTIINVFLLSILASIIAGCAIELVKYIILKNKNDRRSRDDH